MNEERQAERQSSNYWQQLAAAEAIARREFPRLEFRAKSWAWFKGFHLEVWR